MVSGNAIRERLISYLLGEISLAELEEWVVSETWNVHQTGDQSTQDLVFSVELLLAEHSSGHRTEEELREEFRKLLSTVHMQASLGPGQAIFTTGSSSTVTRDESVTLGPVLQWEPVNR